MARLQPWRRPRFTARPRVRRIDGRHGLHAGTTAGSPQQRAQREQQRARASIIRGYSYQQ